VIGKRVVAARKNWQWSGPAPRTVDFHLVSASNRDLPAPLPDGEFREDLYHRIRGFDIRVPALHERREDIPLVRHFASIEVMVNGIEPPTFSNETIAALMDHRWPGNVRELRSAISFAVPHSTRGVVRRRDLPPEIANASASPRRPDPRHEIVEALEQSGGNRSRAARNLGISRAAFYRRLRQLGIERQ